MVHLIAVAGAVAVAVAVVVAAAVAAAVAVDDAEFYTRLVAILLRTFVQSRLRHYHIYSSSLVAGRQTDLQRAVAMEARHHFSPRQLEKRVRTQNHQNAYREHKTEQHNLHHSSNERQWRNRTNESQPLMICMGSARTKNVIPYSYGLELSQI